MHSPVPVRLLLFAVVCLVPAACADASDTTSRATPATTTAASASTAAASQACADAAALKASIAKLDQLDPRAAGKAGIQAALDDVRTSLAALKTSAKSQWNSQITELDAALEALRATVAGINGDNVL